MGIFEILSLILNVLLGTGFLVTFVTLKSAKLEAAAKAEKAVAEVKSSEIQNVEAAIKIWRDMAESMATQNSEIMNEVEKLRMEVNRLRLINNKIVRLLDRITPENMSQMVQKIKEEIDAEEAFHNNIGDSTDCRV